MRRKVNNYWLIQLILTIPFTIFMKNLPLMYSLENMIIKLWLIILMIFSINVMMDTSFFRFYNGFCKYGFFIRYKTNYDEVKSMLITERVLVKGRNKVLVVIKNNHTKMMDGYVSFHSDENLNKFIDINSVYYQDLMSINIQKNKDLTQIEVEKMRSFITGIPFSKAKDIEAFLQNYKGNIYIKDSIYNLYNKDIINWINKSYVNKNQIIILNIQR